MIYHLLFIIECIKVQALLLFKQWATAKKRVLDY